jgi:hypothetical protein
MSDNVHITTAIRWPTLTSGRDDLTAAGQDEAERAFLGDAVGDPCSHERRPLEVHWGLDVLC